MNVTSKLTLNYIIHKNTKNQFKDHLFLDHQSDPLARVLHGLHRVDHHDPAYHLCHDLLQLKTKSINNTHKWRTVN